MPISINGDPFWDVTELLLDEDWRKNLGLEADVSALPSEDQRTAHCPICHERYRVADGALSRHDNIVRICSKCGRKQATSQALLDRANGLSDKTIEWKFCPVMVANSNQMRRLAGTAHQLDLEFGLDFRLDCVLDSMGLHVLRCTALIMPDHPESPIPDAIVTCEASLKIAFLTPDQPIETVMLSIRLRDWIALMEPDRFEKMASDIQDVDLKMDMRLLIPDEFTGDRIDPADPTSHGVATNGRPRLPSTGQFAIEGGDQ